MAEYIEREAALEAIMGQPPDAHYPDWYAKDIKKIPAADVVEVRHGEWLAITDFGNSKCFGICSVCGTIEKAANLTTFKMYYKHCRWCGAKMDGKEVEGE